MCLLEEFAPISPRSYATKEEDGQQFFVDIVSIEVDDEDDSNVESEKEDFKIHDQWKKVMSKSPTSRVGLFASIKCQAKVAHCQV